jgi:hypothetical protein
MCLLHSLNLCRQVPSATACPSHRSCELEPVPEVLRSYRSFKRPGASFRHDALIDKD